MKTDAVKLTGPKTFTDENKRVKLLCIIMFDISKIKPES